MITTLEEVLNLITSDLELNDQDKREFIDLFTQLVVFNIILEVPEQYKEGIKAIIDDIPIDQNVMVDELNSLGIDKDQARQIIEASVKKSVSGTLQKYNDVLTPNTKDTLRRYI